MTALGRAEPRTPRRALIRSFRLLQGAAHRLTRGRLGPSGPAPGARFGFRNGRMLAAFGAPARSPRSEA